jgi:hypothetical protein
VKTQFHTFLASAIDGDEVSAFRSDRFTPTERAHGPRVGVVLEEKIHISVPAGDRKCKRKGKVKLSLCLIN